MSRFLKLKDCMINISHIRFILLDKPKVYKIDLAANWFNGYWMLGSGSVSSQNYEVTVCEKENPEDYKTLTEWINKN
jgi:hypothetical protein